MNMEGRFIRRFESYVKSLDNLKTARTRDPEDDFVISGTVQRFNLTFDIAWKVMKDIIIEYYQVSGFVTGSPREVLKQARQVGLIEDDR